LNIDVAKTLNIYYNSQQECNNFVTNIPEKIYGGKFEMQRLTSFVAKLGVVACLGLASVSTGALVNARDLNIDTATLSDAGVEIVPEKPGWYENNSGEIVFYNSALVPVRKYVIKENASYDLVEEKWEKNVSTSVLLSIDGETTGIYLADEDGQLITDAGIYKISGMYYEVGEDGTVKERLLMQNGYWVCHQVNTETNKYEVVKSGWVRAGSNTYYFNRYGYAIRHYSNRTYSYWSNKNWHTFGRTYEKIAICLTYPCYYYVDDNGKLDTTVGWKTVDDSNIVYVGSNGYIAYKLCKQEDGWYYYTYSITLGDWVVGTNSLKNVGNMVYELDGNGKAVSLYDINNKAYYTYEDDKWNQAKNCTLSLKYFKDKYYYFDSDGVMVTDAGYKTIDSDTIIYVCKAGYVSIYITRYNTNNWNYYTYNSTSCEMVQNKSCWRNINGNIYYFCSTGTASRVYFGKTKKAFNYINGAWITIKNNIALTGMNTSSIRYYYFNSNGVLTSYTDRWLSVSSTYKIHFDNDGYVDMRATYSGGSWQYSEYDATTGKWETYTGLTGQTIADEAVKYVGGKYVSGGKNLSTGVDCSGFVYAIMQIFGIDMPGSCQTQVNYGKTIPLNLDLMQPGDLVFYSTGSRYYHVAIYIGDGNVVHALNSKSGIVITTYNWVTGPTMVKRIVEAGD
jgi:hypothetical protein